MASSAYIGEVAETENLRWIGRPPTLAQLIGFVAIGTIGLIIAGVQPLLLGALVSEQRLSASALGWTVTVEFLAMGAGAAGAGAMFSPHHLRLRGIVTASVLAAVNIGCTYLSGLSLLAARGAAGLAEGILGWLVYLMLARSAAPTRLNGTILVTQGLAQIGFAAVLPFTVMKTMGANGGFIALAGTALIAAIASLMLPDRLAPLPAAAFDKDAAIGRMTPASLASLTAVGLLYAFFIGFFSYLAQLAGQAGLSPERSGIVIASALASSILGSAAAMAFAVRLPHYRVFLLCLPLNLVVLAILWALPGARVFLGTAIVYGFFWGLLMPLQLPFVIEIDPGRRAAEWVPGATALGAAGGPLLCSLFVTDLDARGALFASGLCLIASFMIATTLHLARTRRLAPPDMSNAR